MRLYQQRTFVLFCVMSRGYSATCNVAGHWWAGPGPDFSAKFVCFIMSPESWLSEDTEEGTCFPWGGICIS